MASHGKNMLASGTGATNATDVTDGTMLKVEITTNQCSDDEAYIFEIPQASHANWYNILDAIETLYGHEGVRSIYIYVKD